ncbi:helicase SKI2W-like isoform X2 [Actinia tenebrosa]|uniref:Helicase SKI2W-like isoform X2 n=1 Tax=Actinia tenebrosa TaxID=6105 RepID=A0A6P8IJV2_ACTTE|nr:helicase SKI2W-like isoform X2 [Actinia tenebrosa]
MEENNKGCGFDILDIGCSGINEVVITPNQQKMKWKHLSTLPCGLPVWFENNRRKKMEEYLCEADKLKIHAFNNTQGFWPREKEIENAMVAELCAVQTSIKVERNPKTGKLRGFNEVFSLESSSSGSSSMALNRQPCALSEPIKGKSTNFPFFPGGMDHLETKRIEEDSAELNFVTGLLDTPPGFDGHIKFDDDKSRTAPGEVQDFIVSDVQSYTDLEDLEYSDHDNSDDECDDKQTVDEKEEKEDLGLASEKTAEPEQEKEKKEKWAFMIDVSKPVVDFHKKVLNMAHKWDFEPDTFQKQAIVKLESHDSVFVAAHTSAGKTAVAEYAIGLANRHKTKTIYTSPIKALSNQKFRDFKKNLVPSHPELDIGLITGDVQIKPEAACLIMTTEILRSMLYNGSDVIRDVEWVIFDEVHYINDPERGVVWEEVIIMLPDHVSIILLSATVPNTLEFADWIGRTKRKKIYVISTPKRPVPLEHFLYTGNSNKTSSEMFVLLDQNNVFQTRGYQMAADSIKERSSKGKEMSGAKGGRSHMNLKSEKNIWLSLVTMLEKKEKLPVVAFTFSRKKCDDNADQLGNLNLITSLERSKTQVLMQKYLAKLKGGDRTLPQVVRMQELLKRGIGVHHSGILPILKEVIEILFQEGLVKLLFATETFAMGVNMPARTVVFDSIRKHDGSSFRNLLPGEYVQMAGRAGRRGKDITGTVIILCKGDVPEMAELYSMMLGKPISLHSQFRLTYSMILNLLRVEQLRVQEMMKRSFAEFNAHRDAETIKHEAEKLEAKLSKIESVDCLLCNKDLMSYHQALSELTVLREQIKVAVLSTSFAQKALLPGRIITLETHNNQKALAIVLQVESDGSGKKLVDKSLTVLSILDNGTAGDALKSIKSIKDENHLEPHVKTKLLLPEGPSTYDIFQISVMDVCDITTSKMKIEGDRIIQDHRKRMQPRFSNDPPSRSTVIVRQELLRLIEANPEGLEVMDPIKDFNIRDLDLVDVLTRKCFLEDLLGTFVCTTCPKLKQHFSLVRNEITLRENLNHLQFLLSDDSLQLIKEYNQRIEICTIQKLLLFCPVLCSNNVAAVNPTLQKL